MRILVTGGTGYIGSHTVTALLETGYEVISIDNYDNSDPSVNGRIEKITGKKPQFYQADVCDRDALKKIFNENAPIDGVIHFAAYKAVGESVEHPLKYFRNNLLGLVSLMEVMQETECRRLVFSSSCTVYGEPKQLPVTEKYPIVEATSPYGYTKQVGEQMIRAWVASEKNTKAFLLRYFNPIGAHPSGEIGEWPRGVPNNLVPYITQTAIGIRHELRIFGTDYPTPDGTCVRDFIHVCDLAEAHVRALESMDEHVSAGLALPLNIGTGKGISVKEALDAFIKATGVSFKIIPSDRRPGDVPAIWADAGLAKKLLGWEPRFSLEDSMRTAWQWEQNLRKENNGN